MRSCEGLAICDSTTVSPDRTDLTRASKGMLDGETPLPHTQVAEIRPIERETEKKDQRETERKGK